MAILHTVNKSPFDKNSLERAVGMAKEGSSVLLLEDGVYGAVSGAKSSAMVEEAMKTVKVYALGADLDARGIKGRVIDGIELVDYAGFVKLAAEHSQVQSWL
ncbi:sulfurtransferase complex subunit TusB [Sulfuriflexus mobilis]|uniref:sulfurtransferase complex subunit TusB n=1 Tax=Sulfuriflexus mobilis TaxID=1811807 RepID=UPI0015592B09|nr:sulfurtransferase complex subunit TusB [Sulfuriflexus mobilis]